VPSWAKELSPEIVALHSSNYRAPSQLAPGGVLLVGAGNSGSQIALEVARSHAAIMSGRDTGEVPFRIGGFWGRFVIHGVGRDAERIVAALAAGLTTERRAA
jgi:putative flavoprotein involved in K+ transport